METNHLTVDGVNVSPLSDSEAAFVDHIERTLDPAGHTPLIRWLPEVHPDHRDAFLVAAKAELRGATVMPLLAARFVRAAIALGVTEEPAAISWFGEYEGYWSLNFGRDGTYMPNLDSGDLEFVPSPIGDYVGSPQGESPPHDPDGPLPLVELRYRIPLEHLRPHATPEAWDGILDALVALTSLARQSAVAYGMEGIGFN